MTPGKMDKLMQSLNFQILPYLGIHRHINKKWRMLPERYQRLGLPNFVVWSLAVKISFVQRHLGAAGQMMIQAYEAFLTEVGVYGNGFAKDFETYGILATEWTWFRSL